MKPSTISPFLLSLTITISIADAVPSVPILHPIHIRRAGLPFLTQPQLRRRQTEVPPRPVPKVIPVVVGSPTRDKSLLYYPDNIRANPGDIIQFQFSLNNHTVTEAAGPSAPCVPKLPQLGVGGAVEPVNSGFVPGTMGGAPVPTFTIQVRNTEPMYLYCAQGMHCQLGMVMVVNGKSSNDITTYKQAAMAQNMNVPAAAVSGGILGTIPANLALPPPV